MIFLPMHNTTIRTSLSNQFNNLHCAIYVDQNFNFNRRTKITTGLRVSADVGSDYQYYVLEPRLSLSYDISNKMQLLASYARTGQSVFQAGGGIIGLYDEYWFQVSKEIGPQISNLLSLGVKKEFESIQWRSSLYYKHLSGMVDAQIGIVPSLNINHLDLLAAINKEMTGYAYGFENSMLFDLKRFSSNLAYTYARSRRNHPEIFDGNTFNATFDRPHVLNCNSTYQLSKKWSATSNFILQSGIRYSNPAGYILDLNGFSTPIYEARNNKSFPSYHRLDIGLQKEWTSKKGNQKKLNLSLINAYNRKNLSLIYASNRDGVVIQNQVTLIPILGSIAYSISWE